MTATIERGLRREATRPSRSASRASFFSSKRDRSVSCAGFLMAPSLEKTRWGVVIQLRRLYITLLAGETRLTQPTEACCERRIPSAQRRWARFGFKFRVLIAGSLATALLSLPIDTCAARMTAEPSPRGLPVAQAEEHGG